VGIQQMPIIVRFESQRCVGYRFPQGKSISIMKCIGFDEDGSRWQFKCNNITDNKTGVISIGKLYNFRRLS